MIHYLALSHNIRITEGQRRPFGNGAFVNPSHLSDEVTRRASQASHAKENTAGGGAGRVVYKGRASLFFHYSLPPGRDVSLTLKRRVTSAEFLFVGLISQLLAPTSLGRAVTVAEKCQLAGSPPPSGCYCLLMISTVSLDWCEGNPAGRPAVLSTWGGPLSESRPPCSGSPARRQ